jgi:hypothetical protein
MVALVKVLLDQVCKVQTFKYAKNATNKGMFETIWNGTNGGMGAKGFGDAWLTQMMV